jgi:hypothetical protein
MKTIRAKVLPALRVRLAADGDGGAGGAEVGGSVDAVVLMCGRGLTIVHSLHQASSQLLLSLLPPLKHDHVITSI